MVRYGLGMFVKFSANFLEKKYAEPALNIFNALLI